MLKKNIFSIVLFLVIRISFSQSIPNGGFESWVTSIYENPISFVNTSNYQFLNGNIQAGVNVIKTTDAYHGAYAIKLTTTGTSSNTAFAYFANGDPGKTPALGGIPYSEKPAGIRFYYKCNVLPTDTALFLAVFKKAGVAIGTYIFKITGTQNAYTLLNPTFNPALTVSPDTIVIAATSSNAFANNGVVGSTLQVDSISFTGVNSQPLNFNGDFELWQPVQNDKLNGWNLRGEYQKTNDIFTGHYAVELQTTISSFGGNSINSGECNTGYNLWPSPIGVGGGYAYTNQIDTLVFYYKYIPADPTDNGEFYIYFKKNGVQTYQTYNSLSISPSYQKVSIPFNLATAPDSINVMFRSSRYPILNSYAGSDLKIDNLYLTSQKNPITQFSLPSIACQGQAIQLTDNSGNMPNAWAWILPGGATPGSSTLQNPIVTYNTIGTKTISMIATNQFGSGVLISQTMTVNALPVVSASSTITACGGSNVVLTATGANSYIWNSGQTTSTIAVSATVSTNFTVTGISNGCSNSAIASVIVPSAITPQICMVTADSLGLNNEIYWDKTLYAKADSFIIYRETPTFTNNLTGSYSRIGALSRTALSMFTDTARSVGGFVNGNPNFTSYKYKLQILDSCGQYSALSPYHQTIFVQDQQNGNFNWNPYAIEGFTNTPVSNYILTRRNLTTGATSTVAATTSNLLSDPYYNVFYATNIKWYVDAQGFNCNPTLRVSNILITKQKTKSNQANERTFPTTGIKNSNLNNFDLTIYPNPCSGVLNINSKAFYLGEYNLNLTDILGQNIYSEIINDSNGLIKSIDIKNLNNGIYFLNISKNGVILINKKVILIK